MQSAARLGVDSDSAKTWCVEFTGSDACEAIRQKAHSNGNSPQELTIADFAGRLTPSLFDFSSTRMSGKALATVFRSSLPP